MRLTEFGNFLGTAFLRCRVSEVCSFKVNQED